MDMSPRSRGGRHDLGVRGKNVGKNVYDTGCQQRRQWAMHDRKCLMAEALDGRDNSRRRSFQDCFSIDHPPPMLLWLARGFA